MKHLLFILAAVVLVACGTKEEKPKEPVSVQAPTLEERIAFLEQKLFGDSVKSVENTRYATEIVTLYTQAANKDKKSFNAPEYLFKAGEVSMGIKAYDAAIATFKRITDEYAGFDKYMESLYLQAFIYDVHLNQKGKASEVYKKVIEKDALHVLAKDAAGALQVLTLSDEELIKKFEAKNK